MRDLDFTDLFLEPSGADIRGIRGDAEGSPILRAVPDWAFKDMADLRAAVAARGTLPEFPLDHDGIRFRCTRIDDVDEVWHNLRRSRSPVPRLEELRLGPSALTDHLVRMGSPGQAGLVVVCGSMGHGKTTTSCSLIQEWLLRHGDVAVTVEDPPEMVMNGRHGSSGRCYQTQAPGGDFGLAMRLTVRRSPRYILLGETRGPSEASQAIRAAVNGQIVVTTVHAADPVGGIQAMLKLVSGHEDMELSQQILADGLLGVIHQELVRAVEGGEVSLRSKVSSLFLGRGPTAARSLIRSNKLAQLSTEIAAQEARLARGRAPVQDP